MPEHAIVFLLFDGAKLLDVSGPAEVFAEATAAGASYRLSFVSPTGEPVSTSVGLPVVVDGRADQVHAAGTVVIVGGDRLPREPISPDLIAAASHLVGLGSRVCSICTGAFVLAATGAVNGRHVTTHWEHAARLSRAYPGIRVDQDRLFVSDGRFHTSAGVSSGIDLALSVVEADHGVDLARRVARQLVVHLRRQGGQSQFSAVADVPQARSSPVQAVVRSIASDPKQPAGLAELARVGRVSTRHLSRLFNDEIGMTPAAYVETVRMDLAKNALLGGETVAAAARLSGLGSAETMRRLFVSRLGIPPSVYRQRFLSSRPEV